MSSYNLGVDDYSKQNSMDRVIDEALFCLKKEYANYKKFKNNKNCLFIENEDFSTNTNENINNIQE